MTRSSTFVRSIEKIRSKLAVTISGGENIFLFVDSGAKEDFVPIQLVNIPNLIVKNITGTGFVFLGGVKTLS